MDELVFAIPTVELWSLITYKEQGLIQSTGDVLKGMVRNGLFRNRRELEEDPSYKQLIPYAVISCKESYYLFKRTSGQTEQRLHNQLTLGVGGHMNPGTLKTSEGQYLIDELKREFFEEVKLLNACQVEGIEFIGFINDDTIPVGTVHIGLLYHIHLSSKDVTINERDKMTAEWIKKKNLPEFYEEMETWTKIAFDDYIK